MSDESGPFLVFDVGASASDEGSFALPVSSVSHVIEPSSLAPVPLAPKVVRGIMNHHGRIVTVVDPSPILGLLPQQAVVSQVVVLRLPKRGLANLGLQIVRSHGIVPKSELTEVKVPEGPCVGSVLRMGKRLIHLVMLDAFLEKLVREFGSLDSRESGQGVSL